jgi:D-glycero-D-manno-heptose 1,7-bisphosphate phosphatase
MAKAIFIDRDGVINKAVVRNGKPHPPTNLGEVVIIDGVPDALAALKQAGYFTIVVTNQPDVARNQVSQQSVREINDWMSSTLFIDEFRVCYHDDKDNCHCRKPKPGLLLEAISRLCIDPEMSYMIGDRWRDVECGLRAGCKTIFIDYGYDERRPVRYDYLATSLLDASQFILKDNDEEN